jgi:hypothetical protein
MRRARAGAAARDDWSAELPESPPDSRIARDAFELAESESSAALLAHCVRTWLWADLFAQRDGVAHDPELLYVACLLHDLGLTHAHWCATDAADCFAVEGALAAQAFALERSWPEQRADRLAEAIALHLNVDVGTDLGAEAHLLHAGAGLDVVARRRVELPAATRALVHARHPRDGFADELGLLMPRQTAARPRSRIALLWRLGFGDMIQAADRVHAADQARAGPTPAG